MSEIQKQVLTGAGGHLEPAHCMCRPKARIGFRPFHSGAAAKGEETDLEQTDPVWGTSVLSFLSNWKVVRNSEEQQKQAQYWNSASS